MYDILDVGDSDSGNDNFKAYKPIVFDRIYNGSQIGRVTDISGYENIGADNIGTNENGENFSVQNLEQYLKTAYDPNAAGSGFSLGNIEVIECVSTITSQTTWQLVPSEIKTWYGDKTFSEPEIKTINTVPGIATDATDEEYEAFTYDQITDYPDAIKINEESELPSEETVEVRYVYNKLVNQLPNGETDLTNEGYISGKDYSIQRSNDIYDDAMRTKPGKENKSHYQNWTMNGLAEIAQYDNGNENEIVGAGLGVDYIYTKYTKTNIKEYETITKSQYEMINGSSITQSVSNIDEKLNEFLGLLKNEDGSKGGGTFKQDGVVVRYGDIYSGTIPAGDLLLDNGAEMLFELLEASSNTQKLVNVFKYLAYLYTGHDYGITSVEDLGYIFTLSSVGSFYGNSIEEKIWFALKNAGFSDEAAAAVMGNLYAESGMKANNLEGIYESRLGYTDESYTEAVDNGTYTKSQFVNDEAGYGIAQWTHSTRKQGLYEYCDAYGYSISDENAQINYLLAELGVQNEASNYASVQITPRKGYTKADWTDSNDQAKATEAFCWLFENPNSNDVNMDTRKNMAEVYSNTYKGREAPSFSGNESFAQVAKTCHDFFRDNNFYYQQGNSIPYPNGTSHTDCSAYVSWVLYEYGYKEDFKGWQHTVSTLVPYFEKHGFQKINDINQVKAGDILIWPGHHTEIVKIDGDYKNTYNCGCTESIRDQLQGQGHNEKPSYAYRVPSK